MRIPTIAALLTALPLSLAAAGNAVVAAPQINALSVKLEPTQGNRVAGTIQLSPDNFGLRVVGTVSGLKPDSEHGFHFHQKGDCSAPDATSAGDHFNPDGHAHGAPDAEQRHAGDLPNIKADNKGVAKVDFHVDILTLGDGGKHDVVGGALIVHADPDDHTTQPAGNAGARIACAAVARPQTERSVAAN